MFLAGSHRGGLKALGYDNQLLRDNLQEFCRLWESTSISTCWFFEDSIRTMEGGFGYEECFEEWYVLTTKLWMQVLTIRQVVSEESA
jgi:hypothetical protein